MPDDIAQQILTKLTSLEEGQTELQDSVGTLQLSVKALQGSVASLEKGQVELQGSVKALQGSVASLEEGQAELQHSFKDLEHGQKVLQGSVKALQGSVASLEEGQVQIVKRLDAVEALAEDDRDRFDSLLESVGVIANQTSRIPAIESAVTELQSDNRIIKAAVIDTNRDLQKLDKRVTLLEIKA
ncbi:MAG: hypothetical protein WAQ24_00010 [Candidatus Saccharimonadales bacterium]